MMKMSVISILLFPTFASPWDQSDQSNKQHLEVCHSDHLYDLLPVIIRKQIYLLYVAPSVMVQNEEKNIKSHCNCGCFKKFNNKDHSTSLGSSRGSFIIPLKFYG